MISVGIVFYDESIKSLDIFFAALEAALKNIAVDQILFVQNSQDSRLENFLTKTLKDFERKFAIKTKYVKNLQNNIGLSRKLICELSTSEWIYFTDPDVLIDKAALIELSREAVTLTSERILGITGTIEQSSQNIYLHKTFKIFKSLGKTLKFSFQGTETKIGTFVDHAPTAHVLLRRSVVVKLGNFSEEMKRYGEDLDLTHRAVQQGYKVYFGASRVVHQQNFKVWKAFAKFFNYGQVQAVVFFKNGLSLVRLYRLTPALCTLTLASFLVFSNEFLIKSSAAILAITALFKIEWVLTLSFILIYGIGTLFKVFLKTHSFCARMLFREKPRKSHQ